MLLKNVLNTQNNSIGSFDYVVIHLLLESLYQFVTVMFLIS